MNVLARRRRQRGVFYIVFALVALFFIGLIGLALDAAFIFARAADLQIVADAGALAAARKLDGTTAGIDAAVSAAQSVVTKNRIGLARMLPWNAGALSFATHPNGAWVSAAAAQAAPAGLLYAKLDTASLNDGQPVGTVALVLSRVFLTNLDQVEVKGSAVAGRAQLNLAPIAICALSATPAAPRPPANVELLEFGFRRGVGYNLLNLNPNGNTPAHYLVNPLADAGGSNQASHYADAVVRPFVCAGNVALRSTKDGIYVQSGFPSSLTSAFNSRFDDFAGSGCNQMTAPPDKNIRQYNGAYASWYMNAISGQSAQAAGGSSLITIADLPDPGPVSAGAYGPLWAATRAAKYSASPPYASFSKTDWASLYPGASSPATNGFYSSNPPYVAQTQAASHPGLSKRRYIHVPLLACPAAAGLVQVLGIGKFFLTAKTTSSAIYGEFSGAVTDEALTSRVELFQ